MNRKEYMALSIVTLKEMAKARDMKGLSNAKKQDIVDALIQNDKMKNKKKEVVSEVKKPVNSVGSVKKPAGAQVLKGAFPYSDKPKISNKALSIKTNIKSIENNNTYNHQPNQAPPDRSLFAHKGNTAATAIYKNISIPGHSNIVATYAEINEVVKEEWMIKNNIFVPIGGEPRTLKEVLADVEASKGHSVYGIYEKVEDKEFGFIRCANYLPGLADVYVASPFIKTYNLKTGDIIKGAGKDTVDQKYIPLTYITEINGDPAIKARRRPNFEDLTPIFPNERISMERPGAPLSMRLIDLISPVGKGQRGMIVSPPKAGKTTLIKDIASSVIKNNPEIHLLILLIDERPEEVTDIKEAIKGPKVEIIYSTFDELPDKHRRVSEMVLERAKRLVEHGKDVMVLVDSITRLTRAYNLLVPTTGRSLSGGLDPSALYKPKKFFGAARNMREGGSLTILATALVDTGSKLDDVVYEEFKGTGNMELVLDRKLSERRIFPAIDIVKSGTRRDDLLMKPEEREVINILRREMNGIRSDETIEYLINELNRSHTNSELIVKLATRIKSGNNIRYE